MNQKTFENLPKQEQSSFIADQKANCYARGHDGKTCFCQVPYGKDKPYFNELGDKLPLEEKESESDKFIEWAIHSLQDEAYFSSVLLRIKKQQEDFYQSNRASLLRNLHEKMKKAGKEYGDPQSDFGKIKTEIENEMLDLIGWNMIYAWKLKKDYDY